MFMLGREKIQAELTDTEAFCAKLLSARQIDDGSDTFHDDAA